MKRKITWVMVMILGLVLCTTAAAHMSILIIRECPHCRAHVVQEDTLSGNTFGVIFWTEGKREAKMLPDNPALVKCPEGSGLFWVKEAKRVDSGFDADKGKQYVMAPSSIELLAYLASQSLPKDQEVYLRIHVWWAVNDAWRRLPNSTPAFTQEQERTALPCRSF